MLKHHFVIPVALVSLSPIYIAADVDENNYFKNPPWIHGPLNAFGNNNVYSLGSTLNLNWETNFSTISLVLFQKDNLSYIYLIDRQPVSKNYMWDVDLDGNFNITGAGLETPNIFSLELWEMTDNPQAPIGNRFSCHPFNITDQQSKSSATTNDTSTSLLANVTDDRSSSEPSGNVHSKGLSGDAKIAIGIGVGLGVVCLSLCASTITPGLKKAKAEAEARELEAQKKRATMQAQGIQHQPSRTTMIKPLHYADTQVRDLPEQVETYELAPMQRYLMDGRE